MKEIPEKLFKKIMKEVPILAVNGVVKFQGGIILTKRTIKPFKDYWHLPGGSVKKNEQIIDALKRKVLDETGLTIEVEKLLGIYDDTSRDPRGHWISLCFLAKATEGEARKEVKVFKKLPRKIGFDHKKILKNSGF